MALDGSVSGWLDGVKLGNDRDIQNLWERYFQRLVRLAGARLPSHARRSFDEEDIALSAFHSFCERAGRGQFPQLADRDDLWKVLVTITARKAVNQMRFQTRRKRGGGQVVGESALMETDADASSGLAQFLGNEPTPEEAALFVDEYDRLFKRLDDPTLRTIAIKKLEGYSSEEMAKQLGVSTRTVDRKLGLIRAIWTKDKDSDGEGIVP